MKKWGEAMDYILAYDFGTSGVKAALVDYEGRLIGDKECGYPLLYKGGGFVEQEPQAYWDAVCKATRTVIENAGIPAESVTGMSFSTQGLGIIPLSKDGEILYNNISWVDSRARAQADEINEKLGRHEFDAADVIPKYLWIKQNMPELYEKTAYFLDCTGYLNYMATGNIAMDYSGKAPYSADEAEVKRRLSWYETAGLDVAKCPPLIPCTGYVGNLTEKAAAELGVTTAVEVYMGVVDVTCAAMGAGCCKEGDAHVYLGTSGWLTVVTGKDKFPTSQPGIWQLQAADETKHLYGGCTQCAGMALDWAIDRFYHTEKEMFARGEKPSGEENIYDLVNKEAAEVPASSEGLLATTWLLGEGCPITDEKAKAVYVGATQTHTRNYFVNAMMEAVCYSLRMEIDDYRIDSGGKEVEKLGAIGGGAQSDHWMQMMANVTGVPVSVPENCRHSGAIGSAAIVCVGKGIYKIDEIDRFVRIGKTFYPDPEKKAIYDRQYAIWQKLYPALKDVFADLY